MDLGINGKKAIVCASSKGLGKASAMALAREGVDVWICARHREALERTADEIAAAGGGKVQALVADVTTGQGRDQLLAACPEPDILVNNAGGPPPGDFRDWDQQDWFDAINANMFSAIDMIRRCLDGMTGRGFGRIVNITSVAVKMPVSVLGLSNGARAGLTGFVSGIAREPAQHNVTINNLLPGYVATDRMWSVLESNAQASGLDQAAHRESFFSKIGARRPGDPDEFGAVCAFLCSQQAAYITAQNILMDGGLYPGTF
ncbi:MAG: SDR family oxidoreductase [Xanthomonadales bacterium]|nr:SDR family oxidoreductase [Gammaproteobacteria bacterium]MBT8055218.1 SDR family oxidoreductase [Gammaproteobacteria bacterium]NND56952.1 SDR family oxidoreductase [Xanthomonadales bacterium]NNK51910.1 SDR family oxidoreductase [Xanthomonadales bacterium]